MATRPSARYLVLFVPFVDPMLHWATGPTHCHMSSSEFDRLVAIMARLRSPSGCPWDREQTLESLRPYLIEETYEAIEAIERGGWSQLAEELGDLQLQIVFQSQIASEEGQFTIGDVLRHINEKLIRRHPHVFGNESAETPGQVLHRWEEIKAEEKREKDQAGGDSDHAQESILDGVPRSQPAMLEARKIGRKAASAGFDWAQVDDIVEKLQEEIRELEAARTSAAAEHLEEEVGDLLFTIVNIARHLKVNPELALRKANSKFRDRFAYVEDGLRRQGKSLETAELGEMEQLWQQAKNS